MLNATIVFTILTVVIILVLIVLVTVKLLGKRKDTVSSITLEGQNSTQEGGLCIEGVGGIFDGQRFNPAGEVTIGRRTGKCNICFPTDAKGVSGIHCKLIRTGGAIELTDVGSSFGTFVNQKPIALNVPVLLHEGDRFSLGSTEENMFIVCK